jgi:hypothetical protein
MNRREAIRYATHAELAVLTRARLSPWVGVTWLVFSLTLTALGYFKVIIAPNTPLFLVGQGALALAGVIEILVTVPRSRERREVLRTIRARKEPPTDGKPLS